MSLFVGCRCFRWVLAGTVLLVPAVGVQADEFEIRVELRPGKAESEQAADERAVHTKRTLERPSSAKRRPRRVYRAKRDETVLVRWRAHHVGSEETLRKVLVHFFVDEEKQAGQQAVPKLGKDVVHEGALTLDFKPGEEASGQFTLNIPTAGAYLVRVETQNLLGQHGHEHYAAMDLVIE